MSSQLFSKQQQEQQQDPLQDARRRQEEYLSAQRAAVEATMIGRETLETALRQGEQLQNAEHLADETEYKLDRATRLLRGMTWAGWVANKFSRDVEPPAYDTTAATTIEAPPPQYYEDVPPTCSTAAQAVQNYHANVQVLESCETTEQKETCQIICENMYQQAKREITTLHRRQELEEQHDYKGFASRLGKDLDTLRKRQEQAQQGGMAAEAASPSIGTAKSALFGGKTPDVPTPASPLDEIKSEQESHLDFMSTHLQELGSLASNLSQSLAQHGDTLEALDGKSESMLFKSKMVTRRADHMIQKKSWSKPKTEFLHNASIRHTVTGKYLAVSTSNSTLVLSDKFNETCIFGIWQRQTGSKVFGLKSKYSNRWVGQNLLGHLVCSAYSFDRREEWDADNADWSHTTLLCASAGWGNGGYLMVRKEDQVLMIGGGGLQDKKDADLWCIQEHGQTTATTSAKTPKAASPSKK